jgi:hypothetical protein
MSFALGARESRRDALIMLETHIVMNLQIFRLVLILMFHLGLTLVLHLVHLLVLCLISLMDLTIAHMVLVNERTTLCLDGLVTTHILIMVIVSHKGMTFLQEGLTLTLSPDTWMIPIFPIVVLVPLVQRVRFKRL